MKTLSKSEFMALATNHYYNRKLQENKIMKEADNYIIGMFSSVRDKRIRKRGF